MENKINNLEKTTRNTLNMYFKLVVNLKRVWKYTKPYLPLLFIYYISTIIIHIKIKYTIMLHVNRIKKKKTTTSKSTLCLFWFNPKSVLNGSAIADIQCFTHDVCIKFVFAFKFLLISAQLIKGKRTKNWQNVIVFFKLAVYITVSSPLNVLLFSTW